MLTKQALLQRLGVDFASELHDLIVSLRTPDSMPEGYQFHLADTEMLFDTSQHGTFRDLCGVFGTFDLAGKLSGAIVLQSLTLDGRQWLEFMIFFARSTWGSELAGKAGREVLGACRSRRAGPIGTLVFHKNERAKRYYTKIGFGFDRQVVCDGHALELWRLGDEE